MCTLRRSNHQSFKRAMQQEKHVLDHLQSSFFHSTSESAGGSRSRDPGEGIGGSGASDGGARLVDERKSSASGSARTASDCKLSSNALRETSIDARLVSGSAWRTSRESGELSVELLCRLAVCKGKPGSRRSGRGWGCCCRGSGSWRWCYCGWCRGSGSWRSHCCRRGRRGRRGRGRGSWSATTGRGNTRTLSDISQLGTVSDRS